MAFSCFPKGVAISSFSPAPCKNFTQNKLSDRCLDEEIWTEKNIVHNCARLNAKASHRRFFSLPVCHTTVCLCAYLAVMVAPLSKHAYTLMADTQSNISVNETGGPLLYWVHTALSVSVTAGEEREHRRSTESTRQEKKGERMEAEGRGAEEWWILLIAIVIPPCRKWLPPLSC